MTVSATNGTALGEVTEVISTGANDVLVVSGLQGTGDDVAKSPSLAKSYMTLLQNLEVPGLNELALSRQKGFAIVLVTADVPYTAGLGDEIDISVSSAFDAESLAGGSLDYAILRPPGFSNSDAPVRATVVGAPIPSCRPRNPATHSSSRCTRRDY